MREELAQEFDAVGGSFDIDARHIEIQGQPLLMRTLLNNICANSIKYRDDRRPLHLRASAGFSDSGDVELLIEDNGFGIDPSDAQRIFKPFERLNSTVPGSGIGLATCAEICRRHGWQITATGAKGAGTTFRIVVPLLTF